jgi:uncharacterized protein (TIGR02145 family)
MANTAFAQQVETFIDPRDGKKYKMVKIGSQTWMAQNLDYQGEDGSLGMCYGDKKSEKKAKNCRYGRLYAWAEAKKACPKGWLLPSDEQWQQLVDFAGGYEIAGGKLKANGGWRIDLINCEGDKYITKDIDSQGRITYKEYNYCEGSKDEFGFTALPGGGGTSDGNFGGNGYSGGWWSLTEHFIPDYAFCWYMDYDSINVLKYLRDKSLLFSVRCVRD